MSNNNWGINATSTKALVLGAIVFMIVGFIIGFIRVYVMLLYNGMNEDIGYTKDRIEYIYSRFKNLDLKCNK